MDMDQFLAAIDRAGRAAVERVAQELREQQMQPSEPMQESTPTKA